ncbi:hypothetical protein PAHAL_4G062200 [Panicum hallii]|uniref:Uncharacterized protein n=1 Tax=Panicum hallii TaxID=206008 RepID=A0A2S3HHD0_9POAL|nr:hypothetical protein PAHAL_4G062200 [Panicum hallii]
MQGASKKNKKKTNEATQESVENSLVLAISGPTPMYFPPSQGCSTKLSSGKTEKTACGSSQADAPSTGFPLAISSETPPPAPSQPTGKRKREGKAKAKKTKAAVTSKKQSMVPVPPQSPAMCTRCKTPESPAISTRSKRKFWIEYSAIPTFCCFCHES